MKRNADERGTEGSGHHDARERQAREADVIVGYFGLDGSDPVTLHEIGEGMQHGGQPLIEKPSAVPAPATGEITPLQGGTTVAALLADAGNLEGEAVQLRARITKVSANVAGRNWVTLQDGSSEGPAVKLLATSAEMPEPGDTVVVNGTVRNNVDIGAGYKYKVLLEEASFKTE